MVNELSLSTPSSINVKLFHGMKEQEEKVVGTLLESIEATAPNTSQFTGKGQLLNVQA